MSMRDTMRKMAEDGQKFMLVPECNCISCGQKITRAALNLIWYYDEPGAAPLPGGIAKLIGQGSKMVVQFPVCDTCAPECKKCHLPIKTKAVVDASRRVSRQLGRDVSGFPGCRHKHFSGFSFLSKVAGMFDGIRGRRKLDNRGSHVRPQSGVADRPFPDEVWRTVEGLLEQDRKDLAAGKVPERRLIPHHAIKRDIALRAFQIDFDKLSASMKEANSADYQQKIDQIRRMDQHQLDALMDTMRKERTDLLKIEEYVRSEKPLYSIVDPIFEKPPSSESKPNRPPPNPRGVPLDDLEDALAPTTLKASRKGDSLVVVNDKLTTRVDVEAPENPDTGDAVISAIVTIKTQMPPEFAALARKPSFVNIINRMATLGAVTEDNGQFYIGSRLTVYEDENAWNVQLGLLLFTIISAADTILGGMRRSVSNEPPRKAEPSSWTEQDFEYAHSQLTRVCVCTLGGLGMTAEFGLRTGEVSAAVGHSKTALWQMMANQPHPEMGSGLFCILNMPQTFENETTLNNVLAELNRMEMQGNDLPPHFGAWCPGGRQNNPAYVSFLPNALHSTRGIALNMSIWALNRAQVADAMLQTMQLRSTGNR